MYVGQTIQPDDRYWQHERNPPLRMKEDTTKFKHFFEHFEMAIKYTTPKKYLANKMEKKLIRQYKSEVGCCYNIMRGWPTSDPLYWTIRRKNQIKNDPFCLLLFCVVILYVMSVCNWCLLFVVQLCEYVGVCYSRESVRLCFCWWWSALRICVSLCLLSSVFCTLLLLIRSIW